jgi:hypothetical protein
VAGKTLEEAAIIAEVISESEGGSAASALENVNAQHPPHEKQCDDRDDDISQPLAGGFGVGSVGHGGMVTGLAPMPIFQEMCGSVRGTGGAVEGERDVFLRWSAAAAGLVEDGVGQPVGVASRTWWCVRRIRPARSYSWVRQEQRYRSMSLAATRHSRRIYSCRLGRQFLHVREGNAVPTYQEMAIVTASERFRHGHIGLGTRPS